MTEQYEITFILDEGTKADKVENILKAEGAELKPTQDLGVKQFVYPIKKKTAGNYFAIEFTAEKEKLTEIETELKADKTVIRYLIVKALRKPVDLPPRVKKENTEEEAKAEKVETPAEELEEKTAEAASEPVVETPEEAPEAPVEEAETTSEPVAEEKPAEEEKVEEVKTKEKPARKPRAKAEKVSAEELDKKLEELVKE